MWQKLIPNFRMPQERIIDIDDIAEGLALFFNGVVVKTEETLQEA